MDISIYNVFLTFIVGIIEGITEWLPISSTGHMLLFNEFFPLDVTEKFYDFFLVVIQLGAILAVVFLYFSKLFPFSFKKNEPFLKKDTLTLWYKICVSCIPAVIVGVLFSDTFDRLFYNSPSVSMALIVFGVFFILVEFYNKKRAPKKTSLLELTFTDAALIGMFQVLAAVFPGVSRSGATILGAILIGISRTVAAEYTFFLAVPVMAGASLLKLLKFGFDFTGAEVLYILIGIVTSFVVSIISIKFLVGYIKKHDFKAFGIYRIILGFLVLILLNVLK